MHPLAPVSHIHLQTAREEWEAAQRKLEAEKAAAEEQAAALLSSTQALVAGLEAAAEARSRNLSQIVQQQLEDWRQRVAGAQAAPPPADAAPAAGGGDGSGPKSGIMI